MPDAESLQMMNQHPDSYTQQGQLVQSRFLKWGAGISNFSGRSSVRARARDHELNVITRSCASAGPSRTNRCEKQALFLVLDRDGHDALGVSPMLELAGAVNPDPAPVK